MDPRSSPSYALIRAAKLQRSLMGEALARVGLHAGQERLMMELWETDRLSQVELAERLNVEPPTIAKAVKRLESAGLLHRERDESDSRIQRVSTTAEGRALRTFVMDAWVETESIVLGRLSQRERSQLGELLNKANQR
jgi:DNA-binding MarR family transcriptional regulator